MPAELPDDARRAILDGDDYRCRECGAAVATVATVTLCFPCHATKGLRRHAALVRTAAPDRLADFVKQMTWDLGLNLLAYSEWIDPHRFDPARAVEEFDLWRRYLDTIAALARDAHRESETCQLPTSPPPRARNLCALRRDLAKACRRKNCRHATAGNFQLPKDSWPIV